MDLSNLKPAKGAISQNQRLGRGQGSTKGGTAGRGHKGQKSRSGYSQKFGFEGGQQPIQTRVPKFGFKNINRIEYKGVNLDTLQMLADNKKIKKVDREVLRENGLVSKHDLVKILGRGELSAKLEITAHAFSKSAKEAIEKAGGKAIELPGKREKKVKKRSSKKKPVTTAKKAEEETVTEEETKPKEEAKADTTTDHSDSSEATTKEEEATGNDENSTEEIEEPKAEESSDNNKDAEPKEEVIEKAKA